MNEIEKFQYISLCSKLSGDIFSQIGIKDKVLTEYVIERAIEAKDEDQFIDMMNEDGSEFSLQFCISVFNSVYKMLPSTYIRRMKEKYNKPMDEERNVPKPVARVNVNLFGDASEHIPNDLPRDELAKRFPALALPNNSEEIEIDLADVDHNENKNAQKENGETEVVSGLKPKIETALEPNVLKRKESITSASSRSSSRNRKKSPSRRKKSSKKEHEKKVKRKHSSSSHIYQKIKKQI
jgi:hypothetical protein